ncbi:hypothetical protein PENSPDRAFT_567069, partial [Peniophora sp. CONT]
VKHVRISQEQIKLLDNASLDNRRYSKLDDEDLADLRNPPSEPPDVSDPRTRLSFGVMSATRNTSAKVYTETGAAIRAVHPEIEMLPYHTAKKSLSRVSGVRTAPGDMCTASCMAFTGTHDTLKECAHCHLPRYDPVARAQKGVEVPRQTFDTVLIGYVLQAL